MGFSISPTKPRWRPINHKVKLAYLLRAHSIITDDNGNSYIDCKTTMLTSSGHMYAGHLLIEDIIKNFRQTTAVAGVGLDGYAMASAVSCISTASNCHPIDALYINREQKLIEGNPGDLKAKVVLLSGSVINILTDDIKLINKSGYEVIGVLTLIGYDDLTETGKIPVHSLFTQESINAIIKEWENGVNYPENYTKA